MVARVGKIGFLINPIAGMGGAVGLKGTDGLAAAARARGAKPQAAVRARACLHLLSREAGLHFFAASGEMGEDVLMQCGLPYTVAYVAARESSSEDTKLACQAFLENGVDLILFCGGDGTARDVASSAGMRSILGIPAGVKMHSGVFAISPQAAAELALGFVRGELLARDTEIVDVDEELYRAGELLAPGFMPWPARLTSPRWFRSERGSTFPQARKSSRIRSHSLPRSS